MQVSFVGPDHCMDSEEDEKSNLCSNKELCQVRRESENGSGSIFHSNGYDISSNGGGIDKRRSTITAGMAYGRWPTLK